MRRATRPTMADRYPSANISYIGLRNSVADPDPSDPYAFGPHGSGSISQNQRHGSGSFYHQAHIVRKTLIPNVLLLLFDFFSLKNYVNVLSKSNNQKNFFYISFLVAS